MDLNPMKKVKFTNSPVPEALGNVDEPRPELKFIAKLDHDCLAKVLLHIPILERLEMENDPVCQKWREALELSWYDVKKLDFENLMITLDKRGEILEKIIMKCCRYLSHLIIIGDQYPWMKHVLKNNCQNIIHFDIEFKFIDRDKICDEDLVETIKSMTKLKYVRVKIDRENASNVCNEILEQLPMNMEEIHLIENHVHTTQMMKIALVLDKFNGLHCLTLQGFIVTDGTVESILQSKNTLIKLDLSNCMFLSGELPIFSNLENLEHLNLWEIEIFNVNEIVSIAHNCLKLKHFEFFNRSSDVPYHIFCELKYLKLEHLRIVGIDYSSNDGKNQISDIANNWKELKYLNVGQGRNFSPLDIQEITKFKNLEFLDLHYSGIDSQAFINIASNCLELKELIVDFQNISKIALKKLTNLKRLEELSFSDSCKNVFGFLGGNLLFEIVNNCKNLMALYLHDCRYVTEASLIQVGKLQHLKKLLISNNKNIPNAMFDDFHNLEYLSCYKCPSVTDENIIKVIDNCTKLSFLNLVGTGITVRTLNHASSRQFAFKPLNIYVDYFIKKKYRQKSSTHPYLTINFLY